MPIPTLLSADAIFPFAPDLPPLLRNAGIIIENGRITTAGELADLQRQFNELPADRQHVPGVLLPGFINAHTHLELSYQRNRIPGPTVFTQWVARLMQNYPPPEKLQETITTATLTGIRASLAAGVTCVGDISRACAITRPILAQSPLRAVSFGEIVSLGKMRDRLKPMLDAAADTSAATDRLAVGLSPHAPYTVETPALRAIVRRALSKRLPIAMHLAELAEESAFLRDLSGPLGREWDIMLNADILDEKIPTFPFGPIRWAQSAGLVVADRKNPPPREFPVVLAHVNYLNDSELKELAASTVSVAYCPRTRAFFGHDAVTPHRYRAMLDAGINVCLATDSLASNPDLSPLNEAQFVRRRDQLPALLALEMITARAADALAIPAGRLSAGRYADIIALPVAHDETDSAEHLAAKIIDLAPAPSHLWINGTALR